MRDEDDAHAVTATLWRKMLERGPGTIKRTEEAIGVAADGLRAAKNSKHGLRLWHVTEAVKALGIPLPVFLDEAIGGIATTALDRFMARGAELAASNLVDLPELVSVTTPDRLAEDDLSRLDALRFEAPEAAAEQAAEIGRQAARDGRRGDAMAAVARQGSALRIAEQWEEAWACVWWALESAPDGPIKGDALRRGASVVSDFGWFDEAASLSEMAGFEYMRSGDIPGIGRALLGSGTFLRRSGDLAGAQARLNAAAAFLPPDDHLRQVTLYKNLAHVYVSVGDFDSAEGQAAKAEAIRGVPGSLQVDLHWLQARIAAGQSNYDRAVSYYARTIGDLGPLPGNAALAAAELCRVYLQAGRSREALETACSMARFAMPKTQNPVVSDAIVDLYRSAREGVLTMVLAEAVIERIRGGLERRAVNRARPVTSKP